MDVHDGKIVAGSRPRKCGAWSAERRFFQYVQGEIQGYLKGPRTASR